MSQGSHRITSRPIIAAAALVWLLWLALMQWQDLWHLFGDVWFMTLTMCAGSFIAGATSEGGGAVAFPVMTLLFNIPPAVARDFSLMIQSVGMIAAAFTIFCLRIRVIRQAILYAGMGGLVGITFGLDVVSPLLPPAYSKIFFTSVWLSFALALFWINRDRARAVNDHIQDFSAAHALILVGVGFIGGIVSSITGSGLDILTFAVLVLGFRIDERVATPTSVVLMGMNALAGFAWKAGVSGGMEARAWDFWYVCIPVVVIGAPLGARFIRNKSRLAIAAFLYASILVQYCAALLIVPQTVHLVLFNFGVLALGLLLFYYIARFGERLAYRRQPRHLTIRESIGALD